MLDFFSWIKKKLGREVPYGELLLLSPDEYRSKYLSNTPVVILYLPKNWKKSKKRYPVLYAHDGQNLFDARTSFVGEWYLDDVIESLRKKGLLSEMIVAGIYNNGINRMHEYTPSIMPIGNGMNQGGLLDKHGKFIVEELKPYLDERFPTDKTRENTGLIGSSLGALASFYLLGKYPEIFSKAAVLSPSFWWNNVGVLQDIEKLKFPKDVKIYIDGGWKEGEDESGMIALMRRVYHKLKEKGLKDMDNLFYYEDPEGIHNEKDWTRRSPMALLYLYGKFSRKIQEFKIQLLIKEGFHKTQIFALPVLKLRHGMLFTALSSNFRSNKPDMLKVSENGEIIPLSHSSSWFIEANYESHKSRISLPGMK